jgi:hypothetical protein
MRASHSLFACAATTVCLAAAVLIAVAARPAGAAKDACTEAVGNLYNVCHLKFSLDADTLDFTEALQMCEEQEDETLRDCWTNCATDILDCGKMVECIDNCFNGLTACGFEMQFLYDFCSSYYLDPDTQQPIDRVHALDACRNDATGLYECYQGCDYKNWENCGELNACNADCLSALDDDDNDDESPADDDESPQADPGKPLKDVHGSSCGI